jgi:hypothetical protein
MRTLSVAFDRELSDPDMIREREDQAVQMVLAYLQSSPVEPVSGTARKK